jgi:hypothetical protein
MKNFIAGLILYGAISCSQLLYALPAQVIIIRHAEKDPITRGLTQQGMERAAALAYYLTQTNYLLNFGPPFALFASRSVPISDRLVPRTIETMMPTANYLQLPIHISFNGYQVTEMANLILNDSRYEGKNIIICWNHSSIHDLLNAFGYQAPFSCMPPNHKYPDCRFDLTFVLTFPAPASVAGQLPYATVFFQQLLFGDLTCQTSCNPPMLPPYPCSFNSPSSPLAILVCDTICPNIGLGDD